MTPRTEQCTLRSAMDLQPFRAAIEDTLRVRGWSLNRLGRETKIQASVISRWLNVPEGAAASRPSPANLEKLAPVIGVPYEDLMRMCGYLPGEARAQVDVMRQAARDQVDAWLTAVGPQYEEYFWDHVKVQGDATARLIEELRSAVNPDGSGAVKPAVSAPRKGTRPPRKGGSGPLRPAQHGASDVLDALVLGIDRRRALVDRRRAA